MSWLGFSWGARSPAPPLDPPPHIANASPHGPAPAVGPPSSSSITPSGSGEAVVRKVVKVAVLLDGDADYFTGAFLLKGFLGGQNAALDLRNKLRSFVLKRESAAHSSAATPQLDVQILVQSFMNTSGLSRFLRTVDLASFAQGFNSTLLPFSMVDAGPAKQAADIAIKSHLAFHLASCDYVILGGSHDGGYAGELSNLPPETLRKVLLLRTTPYCARPILELGLEEVSFKHLFEGRDPSTAGPSPFEHAGHAGRAFLRPSVVSRPQVATTSATESATAPGRAEDETVSAASAGKTTPVSLVVSQGSTSAAAVAPAKVSKTLQLDRLVAVLEKLRSAGVSRPLWSVVADQLNADFPGTIDGRFKEICYKAAEADLVRLHMQNFGEEAIEVLLPASSTVPTVPNTSANNAHVPSTSASLVNASVAPVTDSLSHVPERFRPLVAAIRAAPTDTPEWSPIAVALSVLVPPPYSGRFKRYVEAAVQAKVVTAGPIPGKDGLCWIKLVDSSDEVAIDTTPASSTSASYADLDFRPLVQAMQSLPEDHLEWGSISIAMDKAGPRPYEGRFKNYLLAAEAAGIVKTGAKPDSCLHWAYLVNPSAPSLAAPSPTFSSPPTIDSKFLPLVQAILNSPNRKPLRSIIGYELSEGDSRPYTKWSKYAAEAVALGLVVMGEGGKQGREWIDLKPGLVLPPPLVDHRPI